MGRFGIDFPGSERIGPSRPDIAHKQSEPSKIEQYDNRNETSSFEKRDDSLTAFGRVISNSKLSDEKKEGLKKEVQKRLRSVRPKATENMLKSLQKHMRELEKATTEMDANKIFEKIIGLIE